MAGFWVGGCFIGLSANRFALAIPTVFVSADQSGWQQREGLLWLNNKPFSGWQYQRWPTGDTAFVGTYLAGKAEGQHRAWYQNRQRREVRHYQNGWQEGSTVAGSNRENPLSCTIFNTMCTKEAAKNGMLMDDWPALVITTTGRKLAYSNSGLAMAAPRLIM